MAWLGPLRAGLSLYRKRKQLPLAGSVAAIQYNRYRAGLSRVFPDQVYIPGNVTAPPRDYMSFHPDEYEPHPGEAIFPEPSYTPYQAEPFHPVPEALPALVPEVEPEPPRVEYEDLLMTDEWFDRAMQDLESPAETLDPVPFDNDVTAEALSIGEPALPGPALEQIASGEAVPVGEFSGAIFPDMHEDFGAPDGTSIGPPGGPEDMVSHAGGTPGYDPGSMSLGPLEQVVQETMPAEPQADQLQYGMMPEEMYDDPMMMDPWMMPGMGPMPPGLGPMGPGM